MTIPTGRYVIQNVRSKNQLQLPDPNDGSRVQATSQDTTGTGPLKVGHYYVLSPYSLRLTAKVRSGTSCSLVMASTPFKTKPMRHMPVVVPVHLLAVRL